MKKLLIGAFMGITLMVATAWKDEKPMTDNPSVQPSASLADSLSAERERMVKEVMEAIKGKEKMPADSVFKNIKIFKGMPAERLLMIMDKGWGNALGVGCGHCHNTHDWSSEEKGDKQLARDMSVMTQKINNDLLKKIDGLSKANIGCNTCHRGEKKPGRGPGGGRPGGPGGPGGPPPPSKN